MAEETGDVQAPRSPNAAMSDAGASWAQVPALEKDQLDGFKKTMLEEVKKAGLPG